MDTYGTHMGAPRWTYGQRAEHKRKPYGWNPTKTPSKPIPENPAETDKHDGLPMETQWKTCGSLPHRKPRETSWKPMEIHGLLKVRCRQKNRLRTRYLKPIENQSKTYCKQSRNI